MNDADDPPAGPPTDDDRAAVAPLFSPVDLAGLSLRSRVAMAPMTRRQAPDHRAPDERIAAYYERRAAHGVALIITEGTHVDDLHAPDSPNVPGLFTDEQTDGWRAVCDRVHAAGGAIACQLWHTGRHAMNPIGPSAVPAPARTGGFKATPRAMTDADMIQVRDAFSGAAARAIDAGFDAVEVHGAHGYILDSFVSPEANQRTDAYGGSLANRMRFPLMVVRAVRDAVGPDYPVLYRFSQWKVEDAAALNFPNPDDLGVWVAALAEAGVDVLHASTRDATEPAFEGSQRTLAGWTRYLSGKPTVAVGGVSVTTAMDTQTAAEPADPAPAAALIDRGEADLIAVGRSLIANPDWCEIVADGRWRELRAYDRAHLERLE